jgi:hypothetical protein
MKLLFFIIAINQMVYDIECLLNHTDAPNNYTNNSNNYMVFQTILFSTKVPYEWCFT